MKKVLELREKRAKAWDAAKAFLDARAKDGVLSAEDNTTYDKMLADVDAMARQIAIEEDRVARDAEMSRPTSAPLTEKPGAQGSKPASPRATAEYRADFLNILRGRAPVNNVLSTSPDTDGGYLVPTEFETQIVVWRRRTSSAPSPRPSTPRRSAKSPLRPPIPPRSGRRKTPPMSKATPHSRRKPLTRSSSPTLSRFPWSCFRTACLIWRATSRGSLPEPSASPRRKPSAWVPEPVSPRAFSPQAAARWA